MKKFKFLTRYSLEKRIKSKAFLISNIFILAALILLINLSSIITMFSSEEEYLVNVGFVVSEDAFEDYNLEDAFNNYFELYNIKSMYTIEEYATIELGQTSFDNGQLDVLLNISGNLTIGIAVDYYGESFDNQNIVTTIFDQITIDYQNVVVTTPIYNFIDVGSDEIVFQDSIAMGISMILIVPMFILIIMATQFLGVDIVEEKSSKAIEVIISSVPTKIHYFSKILSNFLFIIIQTLLMLIFGLFGTGINKLLFSVQGSSNSQMINFSDIISSVTEVVPNLGIILVISIIVLLFGSILYLVISALFASMANSQEDYQQFLGPLMITMMLGFYAVTFAPMFGSNAQTILTVIAFIPIFTPIVLPFTLIAGYIGIGWGILAGLLCFIFIYILSRITDPIYKVSILNYDQSKFFKRISNNIKKAFYKEKQN